MNEISDILIDKKNKMVQAAIKQGNEWYEKKVSEGWEETVFGLMSPQEIKESGMTRKNGKIWAVPCEEIISDKRSKDYAKGEKYTVIPENFLRWYRKKFDQPTLEDHIYNETQKQMKEADKKDGIEEMSIDDIPF